MFKAFDNAEHSGSHDLLATAIATEQCDGLLDHGSGHLHFYTLNKADMVFDVCRALGVEPEPAHLAAGCG
jgi:methylenetetrahydrofolate reductase (NADPH)